MQFPKKNIFIVNFNQEIFNLVSILEKNYQISDFNIKNFKKVLKDANVDLILIDDLNINIDIYEIIEKIRLDFQIPIIVITNQNNEDIQLKGLELGVNDYVIKPIKNIRLIASRIKTQIDLYEKINNIDNLVKQKTQELILKDKMLQARSKLVMMGEMFEMITHQWKQPLTTLNIISGSIKLSIKHNRLKYDSLVKKLNDLEQQIVYMSETINDFKSFFNNKKEKKELDLKNIALRAIKLSSHFFNKNNLQLNLNLESVCIIADENELIQVLLNIFNNSRDAFIEKNIQDKQISISITSKDDFALLKIADNAGGILEDVIEKIFEPHFTTKDEKGNGIGLYMSKVIISEHLNGFIYAKNIENGVEFSIKIPILKKSNTF